MMDNNSTFGPLGKLRGLLDSARAQVGLALLPKEDRRYALQGLANKQIAERYPANLDFVAEALRLSDYVSQTLHERYWLQDVLEQKDFVQSFLDRRRGEQRDQQSFLGELAAFRDRSASVDRDFSVSDEDLLPQLNDKRETTPFDRHYLYHPAWAARILARTLPQEHVDIASILQFATMVSAFVPTRFYDFRPAILGLSDLQSGSADLTALPFPDRSIASLSCMHVIEHIGLGRYGDPIDPAGDLKAIGELVRVLAPGGDLLIATPVGRKRVQFNAHRIYDYKEFASYFAPLELVEFSLIEEKGERGPIVSPPDDLVMAQDYGCGCFWFKRKA